MYYQRKYLRSTITGFCQTPNKWSNSGLESEWILVFFIHISLFLWSCVPSWGLCVTLCSRRVCVRDREVRIFSMINHDSPEWRHIVLIPHLSEGWSSYTSRKIYSWRQVVLIQWALLVLNFFFLGESCPLSCRDGGKEDGAVSGVLGDFDADTFRDTVVCSGRKTVLQSGNCITHNLSRMQNWADGSPRHAPCNAFIVGVLHRMGGGEDVSPATLPHPGWTADEVKGSLVNGSFPSIIHESWLLDFIKFLFFTCDLPHSPSNPDTIRIPLVDSQHLPIFLQKGFPCPRREK